MPAAAGDEGSDPAGLCPEAGRIKEDMTGLDEEDDRRARIECARAYVDCGRRHGEEGRLEEAAECLERAVGLHWMWSECSDRCGGIANRLEGGGRLADAVVWYGKAVEYVDRGRSAGADAAAPTDTQREKKHRKRRSRWTSKCIRCWDALVGGAQQRQLPPPGAGLDGPYKAADLAAAGDDKRRASLRVQVGDVELGRGMCGSAAEWYGRAMEIDPGNERATLGAGRALEQDGRWADASRQYESAAAAIPRLRKECAARCARCARSLMSAGSPGDARSAIEAAAGLDTSHVIECARFHHGRGDALAARQEQDGGGQADDAAAASPHYIRAVEWYRRADESAEAAKGCAQCAHELYRTGRADKALSAIEEAAERDASHALECARMHHDRAGVLVRQGCEHGAPGAEAAAEGSAEQGPVCVDIAAAHYDRAVKWYRQAAKGGGRGGRAAEAAKGCAQCARELYRTGRADKALSAIEAAVGLDASHALECAHMHRKRADALAGRRREGGRGGAAEPGGAKGGHGGESAAKGRSADEAAAAAAAHYDRAVKWYRRAAKGGGAGRAAEAAKGCAQCARELYRTGRADKALSAIEEAAECAERCSAMGRAEYEAGRYEEAALHFDAAVSIDGDDAAARLWLADSWRMAGRRADALREYSGARRSGDAGQRVRAYAGLARILAAESRHMDAAGLACMAAKATKTTAADAEPDGADACRAECSEICTECGDALWEQGMHDDAYACYDKAWSINPGNAGANCGIGDHMARQGRLKGALERYEAALEADGDMARALVGAGRMLCRRAGRWPPSEGRHDCTEAEDSFEAPTRRHVPYPERRVRDHPMPLRWGRTIQRHVPYPERRDCTRAEDFFERALKIDQGDFEARMGAGWACLGQKGEDKLDAAVSHFCAAAKARPGDAGARMAAGKALRKLARFYANRKMYEKAADCHRRAIQHYEHAISSPGPGGSLEPSYWKAVCMLHLKQDREQVKAFIDGVLKRAHPQDRALLNFCGRICDILGSYDTACYYYMESLPGNGLYTDGFYGRIDMARVDMGGMAAATAAKGDAPAGRRRRGAAAGTASKAGMCAGGEAAEGGGVPAAAAAVYVLDANVVVECAADRAECKYPDAASDLVEGIRKKDCRIPRAARDEAYGVVNSNGGDLGAFLRDWGAKIEAIEDHRRMDLCMKRAREAMMAAWLYSSMAAKEGWRKHKFGGDKGPYTGGPPRGTDVVILATAAHLADEAGGQKPRRVILVTTDADFLDFKDYIREALSVDVETPDDAARMLASAALERERQAELGRRAGGEGGG